MSPPSSGPAQVDIQPPLKGATDGGTLHIFVVPGAGLPRPDGWITATERAIASVCIDRTFRVHPIDWHRAAQLPFESGSVWLNLDHTRVLMRGLIGAAFRQVSDPNPALRFLRLRLHELGVVAPVVGCWFVASVWAWALETRLVILEWALIVCMAYAAVVSMPIVFCHVIRDRIFGVWNGGRQVLLLALWMPLFMLEIVSSLVGAVAAGLTFYAAVISSSFLSVRGGMWLASDGVPVVGRAQIASALVFVPLCMATFAVGFALLTYISRIFAWTFKFLSDVIAIMGDKTYCDRVVCTVGRSFTDAGVGARDEVIVIGESLGAVIGVLALARGIPVPEGVRVSLVTVGCPLGIVFRRFFPGVIALPDDTATGLAVRYPNFAWVNLYRPHDPLASPMFSTTNSGIAIDRATGQNEMRWWKAHYHYLDDQVVAAAALDAVVKVPRIPTHGPKLSDPEAHMREDWESSEEMLDRNKRISCRTNLILALVFVSVVPVTVEAAYVKYLATVRIMSTLSSRLGTEGVIDPSGVVYRFEEVFASGQNTAIVTRYVVVFTVKDGNAMVIEASHISGNGQIAINRLIKENGDEATVRYSWSVWDDTAKRIRIPVRYLPYEPTVLDFPTVAPSANWEVDLLPTFGVLIALNTLTILLIYILSIFLFPIFIGS